MLRPATCCCLSSSRRFGPASARCAARSLAGSGSFGGRRDERGLRLTPAPAPRIGGSPPSTASRNAARTPCASSTARPAAVVPPGDVTAARSDSGVVVAVGRAASPRRAGSGAPVARCVSRGRPTSTPASIIASATRNTYAGPEPDRPVTASSCASGTRTTTPTLPRIRSHTSRSSSVTCCPAAMAAAPRPTSAPVLGIARTTGRPGATASSAAMVTPAAIDSTSAPSGRTSAQLVERGDRVGRLHREHEHLGVARGPRRVPHDAHAGQARLERVVAVGVDLGDRELLRLPSRRRAGRPRAPRPCDRRPRVPSASAAG